MNMFHYVSALYVYMSIFTEFLYHLNTKARETGCNKY